MFYFARLQGAKMLERGMHLDGGIVAELLCRGYRVVHADVHVTVFAVAPVRRSATLGDIYVPTAIHPRWNHVATVPMLRAGQKRGRHIHLGTEGVKDPEVFLLVMGVATYRYAPAVVPLDAVHESRTASINEGELRTLRLAPGHLVLVQPHVYHEVIATGDSVLLMELMMTPEDINYPDVIRLKE